jgi:glycosyltransferase involved in cell wall biosynthesis
MKITILCNGYPTKKNPHKQIFIKNIKEALEKERIQICLCYNKYFKIWENKRTKRNCYISFIKCFFQIFSILASLKSFRKTDLIFSHAIIFSSVYGVILKKLFKKPLVCYVHGGDINLHYNKKKMLSSLIRYALKNSDYIIANSDDIYEKILSIVPNRENLCVISPGIDLRVMKPLNNINEIKEELEIPKNKYIITAAGNSIKLKGFDILITSISQLSDNIKSNIKVILITEGEEENNYKYIINSLHINDVMEIRKKTTQKQLNKYYNCSDVVISPSRQEALGLVGIEAMASGTLVIGAKTGGIKEIIKDNENGFLFEVDNIKALKKLIIKAYNKDYKIESLQKKAIESSKKHSIELSAQKMIDVFDQTINI